MSDISIDFEEFIRGHKTLAESSQEISEALTVLSKRIEEALMTDVINFIEDFKKGYEFELEDVFLHGYCYWFAKILEERFKGEIYYMPIDNHFITKIGQHFYDIRGILDSTQFNPCSPWEEYKRTDSLETSRIYRDCINKERDKVRA